MRPHEHFVLGYLNKWRNLRAWGRSLNNVDLLVSAREYPKRAGTCWPILQKVAVYHQPGMRGLIGMLKTGLHEFAHAVETKDEHGHKWQERYARAVTEVSGRYVGWGMNGVDEACYRALLGWWRASGTEEIAKRVLGYG